MRAIHLEKTGAPDVLQLRDTPVPGYGDNEVLLDIVYCGLATGRIPWCAPGVIRIL